MDWDDEDDFRSSDYFDDCDGVDDYAPAAVRGGGAGKNGAAKQKRSLPASSGSPGDNSSKRQGAEPVRSGPTASVSAEPGAARSNDGAKDDATSRKADPFVPADEAIRTTRWLAQEQASVDWRRCEVGFLDRFAGELFVPIDSFRETSSSSSSAVSPSHEDDAAAPAPGADEGTLPVVPMHRVQHIRVAGQVVWDREKRLARLSEIPTLCERPTTAATTTSEASSRVENLRQTLLSLRLNPRGEGTTAATAGNDVGALYPVYSSGEGEAPPVRAPEPWCRVHGVTATHAVRQIQASLGAMRARGLALFANQKTRQPGTSSGDEPAILPIITASDGDTQTASLLSQLAFVDLLYTLMHAAFAIEQPFDAAAFVVDAQRSFRTASSGEPVALQGFDLVSCDSCDSETELLFAFDVSGAYRRGATRQRMVSVLESVPNSTGGASHQLPPYLPLDALEAWLLSVSDPDLARTAPTHISQLGGCYHVPWALRSGPDSPFVERWRAALAAVSTSGTDFFVEELRGARFHLYVDIDVLLSTDEPPPPAWEQAVLHKVYTAATAFPFAEDQGDRECDALVARCFGPWQDGSDASLPVRAKLGLRMYFPSLTISGTDEYGHFLKGVVDDLASDTSIALPAALITRAARDATDDGNRAAAWREIVDADHVAWDRNRLVGSNKRRRVAHLGRRYVKHATINDYGLFRPVAKPGDPEVAVDMAASWTPRDLFNTLVSLPPSTPA